MKLYSIFILVHCRLSIVFAHTIAFTNYFIPVCVPFVGGLICFTREGPEIFPGYAGDGVSGDDYCTERPYGTYLVYKGNTSQPANANHTSI